MPSPEVEDGGLVNGMDHDLIRLLWYALVTGR